MGGTRPKSSSFEARRSRLAPQDDGVSAVKEQEFLFSSHAFPLLVA
jgi:hypothetical protein